MKIALNRKALWGGATNSYPTFDFRELT